MVNAGNALHLAFKLHAGRVGAGGSFQVFCGAQLCKHLTFDTAFFTACCYPSRFIAAAVRVALHPDILLLCPAKFLRQLAHHAASRGWFQIRQQGTHPLLSQQAFSRFVQDYLVFGNAYLEKRTNRFGEVIALEPALAKYTRRGLDLDTYWFVQYGMTTLPYQFTKGSIFHLMEPDINQEIYGLPGYLSAIPSALLNESATLFRRKYYINGSHAGFIMYMTDAAQNQEDVNNLRNAMKSAKGPGNFRNLFMYSPNGKKDGLQIIPLSEVAAKDEFLNIKNVSRDDMMAAHRVPPQMMGIMPSNVGGFGDVEKASRVFVRNELIPLQKRLQELNDWLGEEVMRFEDYNLGIE